MLFRSTNAEAVVSLDIRISDQAGRPVGFAPVGSFDQNQALVLKAGVSRIVSRHEIGMLAVGRYILSLDIADPPYSYLDRVENCLSFEVNTPPRGEAYRRMQQAWGYGSVEVPYSAHRIVPVAQ